MNLLRMDNVSIVVEDLDATVAFFEELGLRAEGRMRIDGEWAARIVGLPGQVCDIAMLRTPDGHGGIELCRYVRPEVVRPQPENAPANTLGYRRVMFAVDDLEEALARIAKHGATLVGEVTKYEEIFKLCYVRGPEGLLIGLAEPLRGS